MTEQLFGSSLSYIKKPASQIYVNKFETVLLINNLIRVCQMNTSYSAKLFELILTKNP